MNIKDSLTRKIGPLPAWAWAIIAFGGVWWYRSRTPMASGTGTGSVGPAPATPQDQTTLQPGESVYDPNTGTLSTAPGSAGTNGTTGSNDVATAIQDLATALMAGQQPGLTHTGAGKPRKVPKLTGQGAVRAPFGRRKPDAPKGYKARGLGHGFWEFVPKAGGKRRGKAKAHHGKPSTTTRPAKPHHKRQPRSAARISHPNGGRTSGRTTTKAPVTTKTNRTVKPEATTGRLRNRQSTPLVSQPVTQQRPVAAHKSTKAPVQPSAHRTSSTPVRTVRAPAQPVRKKR